MAHLLLVNFRLDMVRCPKPAFLAVLINPTRFILPILAEYADAGYREPKGRLLFSLRANAQYQAFVLGAGIAGGIYVFIYSGVSFKSLKALVMALAYCWGLIL